MTLSITIMAIGVYYFKFPNNFTFGGVTGAAVVFAKIPSLYAAGAAGGGRAGADRRGAGQGVLLLL